MYRRGSGKGGGKQNEKKGRPPDSSGRWPKFALAPYMTTDGAPFYLRGMAEWDFLACSNIAESRNAGNSEWACRLGVAISESAGCAQEGAKLLQDCFQDEEAFKKAQKPLGLKQFLAFLEAATGQEFLQACMVLNKVNDVERSKSKPGSSSSRTSLTRRKKPPNVSPVQLPACTFLPWTFWSAWPSSSTPPGLLKSTSHEKMSRWKMWPHGSKTLATKRSWPEPLRQPFMTACRKQRRQNAGFWNPAQNLKRRALAATALTAAKPLTRRRRRRNQRKPRKARQTKRSIRRKAAAKRKRTRARAMMRKTKRALAPPVVGVPAARRRARSHESRSDLKCLTTRVADWDSAQARGLAQQCLATTQAGEERIAAAISEQRLAKKRPRLVHAH